MENPFSFQKATFREENPSFPDTFSGHSTHEQRCNDSKTELFEQNIKSYDPFTPGNDYHVANTVQTVKHDGICNLFWWRSEIVKEG